MRAVVQRAESGRVTVDGREIGRIETGLVVLLGVAREDEPDDAVYLAEKVAGLRIFEDNEEKMNRSVLEVGGAVLAVSQFTLLGDARRGRRPSFTGAAEPTKGRVLFDRFVAELRSRGLRVETGEFGGHMKVELVNDGPCTILLDSGKIF